MRSVKGVFVCGNTPRVYALDELAVMLEDDSTSRFTDDRLAGRSSGLPDM